MRTGTMKNAWMNGRLAMAAVVSLGLVGAAQVYGVSTAPRVQAPATAVAVVDVAKIMGGMELVKTESAKLKTDFDTKQKSLNGMQDKIKSLAEQVKAAPKDSAEKRALAFEQIKAEAEHKMTGELFQRDLNLRQGDLYKQAYRTGTSWCCGTTRTWSCRRTSAGRTWRASSRISGCSTPTRASTSPSRWCSS